MQLVHENGRKYWDIWVIGASVLIVHGALYRKNDIRTLFFSFSSVAAAESSINDRLRKKFRKGYHVAEGV